MMVYRDSILGAVREWARTALNPTRNGFALDVFILTGFAVCVLWGWIL